MNKFLGRTRILIILIIIFFGSSLILGLNYLQKKHLINFSGKNRVILSYKMVGGFAGFEDEILIYDKNNYEYISRLRNNIKGQLTVPEIEELNKLRDKYGHINYETPKNTNVIDALYTKVFFEGNNTNNGKGLEDVSSFAVKLIYRIK